MATAVPPGMVATQDLTAEELDQIVDDLEHQATEHQLHAQELNEYREEKFGPRPQVVYFAGPDGKIQSRLMTQADREAHDARE